MSALQDSMNRLRQQRDDVEAVLAELQTQVQFSGNPQPQLLSEYRQLQAVLRQLNKDVAGLS
jgi:chromosome segregation ATPase